MSIPKCKECGQELKPGATGKYTMNQLNPDDQGELRAVMGIVKGRVVFDFGKPVPWIAMTADEARITAFALAARANELDKMNGKT